MNYYCSSSEEIVSKLLMPELNDVYVMVDRICQELAYITIYMSYFEAENKNKDGCSYLYRDDVLGIVFGPIQQSIYESCLMGVARLCDRAVICHNETVGFKKLMKLCKDNQDVLQTSADRFSNLGNVSSRLTEFQNRFNGLSNVIENIKIQRNKIYAHNDINASIDFINKNNDLSIQDLKDVYDLMFDFIQYINCCLINAYIPEITHTDVFGYMFNKLPEAMKLLFEHNGIKRG